MAVTPRHSHDWENLQRAVTVSQQDSSVRIATERTEGRAIISGMGELHLEVICDRLVRECDFPLEIGEPKIIYVETIRKSAEAEAKYIRQVSAHGN